MFISTSYQGNTQIDTRLQNVYVWDSLSIMNMLCHVISINKKTCLPAIHRNTLMSKLKLATAHDVTPNTDVKDKRCQVSGASETVRSLHHL